MSSKNLKKLRIEYLRGAIRPFELAFDPRKRLTLVYGENGTGKSTLCDAFDFLGNGRVGSLDDCGLGVTTSFWPAIGRLSTNVKVVLEVGDFEVTGTLSGRTAVVESPNRPRVIVLRRNQILGLIQARAAERYEHIRKFIDVAQAVRAEESLKKHVSEQAKGREAATAAIVENENQLMQLWDEAGRQGQSVFEWSRQEASVDDRALLAEASALRSLIDTTQNLLRLTERRVLLSSSIEKAQHDCEEAEAELSSGLSSLVEDAELIEELLTASKKYLEHYPEPAICPLCESPERVKGLPARVEQRASQFEILTLARKRHVDAKQALVVFESQLQRLEGEIASAIIDHEKALSGSIPQGVRASEGLLPNSVEQLDAWALLMKSLVKNWEQQDSELRVRSKFLGLLRKALSTYEINFRRQADLDTLLPLLEHTHRVFSEERRRFCDEILSEIAARVGQLYELVHPGEDINRIGLKLDPKKAESLEIDAHYEGQKVPPQAYYSQSHLETLGLCVFLALAEREQPEQTILVLDDVLSSVDEPHVERVIQLLYEETLKFQHCLITTHYRPWREKFRWGWLRSGECHFVELAPWTRSEGLSLGKTRPDVERLRSLMEESPPDLNLVCAKAGVMLEAGLKFIATQYECTVPLRDKNRFTLGELLVSIKKRLRGSLLVEVVDHANGEVERIQLGPILDELTRISQARNVFGCHFNEVSFELLDSDGLAFARRTLELTEALYDPDRGWPRSDKSGSYWATSGETRRLHPLKQPS